MSTHQTTPDVEMVLREHERRQRLVGFRWVLTCSCGGWITDHEFDDRSEMQWNLHRAHLAAVLEPLIREREAKALEDAADLLPALTEGTDRIGTNTWPIPQRDTYSLAIEEAQGALRDLAAEHRKDT